MTTVTKLKWETFDKSWSYKNTQTGSTSTTVSKLTIKASKSRTASGLKDFKSKIDSGENCTTTLTAWDDTVSYAVGRITATSGNDVYINWPMPPSSSLQDTSLISSSLVTSAKAKAYGYLNSYIDNAYSSFSGQTFVGELRETVDMLKDPFSNLKGLCKELAYALLALKKSKLAGKELAEAVSKVWLQFRFGLLPLVNDIDAIVDIINDVSRNSASKKNRFYGFDESSSVSVDNNYATGLASVSARRELTTIDRVDVYLHCGLIFKHDPTLYSAQSGALKELLDASELPSTLYELTPFSWLLDYFTNVGTIISSATQSKADISYISESVVRTRTVIDSIGNVRSTNPNGFIINSSTPAFSRISRRSVDRAARASAIPPLSVSMPGSNVQYLNIAALLALLSK